MMTCRLFPLALLLPVVLSSCGETFMEVATRNQADLDALRTDLKKLGELIAANPPAKDAAPALDPAPVFKEDDEAGSNTALLPWELLADPTKEIPNDEWINLYYSNGIENLFVWSTWGDKKAFENYEAEIKRAAALRYLVAYQKIKHEAPAVDAQLNYRIGGAVLAIYVFDRTKQEIVCSFPVAAMSNAEVNYQYKENENRQSAAQSWARSNLWENLRESVLKGLNEKTGGSFSD